LIHFYKRKFFLDNAKHVCLPPLLWQGGRDPTKKVVGATKQRKLK